VDATLLIVEDDVVTRTVLGALLRPLGRVVEAADGIQAIQLAMSERPDVILAGSDTAELGGVDLCAALRARATTRHTAIVVLSARSGRRTVGEALAAGADAFVLKPFDHAGLQRVVEDLLARPDRSR
jgi:CheY-like chemotaxis protein